MTDPKDTNPSEEIVPALPDRRRSTPAPASQATAELQVLAIAVRSAIEPQAKAQVDLAKIESDTQRHQVDQEAKLIANEQGMRHSRFRHLFWGTCGVCSAFFALAVVLVLQGKEEKGFLVLSHLAALLMGAFGGRALAPERPTPSSNNE